MTAFEALNAASSDKGAENDLGGFFHFFYFFSIFGINISVSRNGRIVNARNTDIC